MLSLYSNMLFEVGIGLPQQAEVIFGPGMGSECAELIRKYT